MCEATNGKYEYINKPATFEIHIIRYWRQWSYRILRRSTGEIIMNGVDDMQWYATKGECKNKLIRMFGDLQLLSDYYYERGDYGKKNKIWNE